MLYSSRDVIKTVLSSFKRGYTFHGRLIIQNNSIESVKQVLLSVRQIIFVSTVRLKKRTFIEQNCWYSSKTFMYNNGYNYILCKL